MPGPKAMSNFLRLGRTQSTTKRQLSAMHRLATHPPEVMVNVCNCEGIRLESARHIASGALKSLKQILPFKIVDHMLVWLPSKSSLQIFAAAAIRKISRSRKSTNHSKISASFRWALGILGHSTACFPQSRLRAMSTNFLSTPRSKKKTPRAQAHTLWAVSAWQVLIL